MKAPHENTETLPRNQLDALMQEFSHQILKTSMTVLLGPLLAVAPILREYVKFQVFSESAHKPTMSVDSVEPPALADYAESTVK